MEEINTFKIRYLFYYIFYDIWTLKHSYYIYKNKCIRIHMIKFYLKC